MKRIVPILSILVLCLSALSAEGFSFDFKNAGLFFADAQVGLTVANPGDLPLDAVLRLRPGYESRGFTRDGATGDIGRTTHFTMGKMPDFAWALGLNQALVKGGEGNLAEAFAFYRGRYDIYDGGKVTNSLHFTDIDGLFGNSFLVGFSWDSTARDSRRVKTGVAAELSGEWAPRGLDPIGDTDFFRVTFKAKGFLPAFSLGQEKNGELNLVSGYLAGFASADWADGDKTPIWVMQSFGGRDLRDSLGDCVRGYPVASFDSKFKAVGNLEFRVNGPALFGLGWLMPVAYVFADGGYFAGFANTTSAADKVLSGFVGSAGAGIAVNLLDFAQAGICLPWILVDQSAVYEEAKAGFAGLAIKFAFHF